jgi:ComF family protein
MSEKWKIPKISFLAFYFIFIQLILGMFDRQSIQKVIATLGKGTLDILFPAQCARCSEPVDTASSLCAGCWPDITFISAPYCVQCGYPFDYNVGETPLCGSCIAKPPPFSSGRSVLKYDEASRDMVLSFKHADRTDQTPAFAQWMVRSAPDLMAAPCLIVPVPLHPNRLLKRRYNQSALLANQIGRLTNQPVAPTLLLRKKATPSQGSKTFNGRWLNVKGAFAVRPTLQEKLIGQRILLIDDVYTTGATLSACADCLLNAGAAQVDILTLCRVVRPANLSI